MAPPERRDHLVCAVAAVAQIVTLRWTWDLWSKRSDPPNLPLAEWLSSFSWGPLLVLLCIATAVRPRWFGPAFGIVLVLACLGDQMRMQPGVVSLAVLMIAPAFGAGGRSIARWHLCSVWLWAGLHKMLSPGWAAGGATFIAESVGRPEWSTFVAVAVPLFEFGLGLTAYMAAVMEGDGRWCGAAPRRCPHHTFAPLRRLEFVRMAVERGRRRHCPTVISRAARGGRIPEPVRHGRCRGTARLPRALLRRCRRRVHQPQPVHQQHRESRDLPR